MISVRLLRKLAACAAILGILSAQFAVAAYACPALSEAMESKTSATPYEVDSRPCYPSQDAPIGLCKAHCEDGQKNVTGTHVPPPDFVPAFAVTLQIQDVSKQAQLAFAIANTISPSEPPLHLRHCVFRI